jgi:asparagine synthase (glutamine-hydrolysing)
MCGIAGFAGSAVAALAPRLRPMCDAILHRGPDEAGYFDGSPLVQMGMRRLSIIDLAGGSQPIRNEDGTITVVFNGEIYNFRELRRMLELRGHTFRTSTDTEVLAHLYEEMGPDLVRELRGMFAFAIWDGNRKKLLLARDRLGIKPLYYAVREGTIVFGSELKVLEAAQFAECEPDQSAIAQFLALGYVPDPCTIYQGVHKLQPGRLLVWERGREVQIRRYWAPPAVADPSIDAQTASTELRRLLSESVRYRLIADVPIGAFLSGGLDSAAVVAEMSRQMDRPVETYSIGFREGAFNEADDAADTAAALGTRHHSSVLTPDADELTEGVLAAFDEPFADSSALPTYAVSRLAAADLKVVLSGDGGDELFGGYTRYLDFQRRDVSIPLPLRRLIGDFARAMPGGFRGRNRLLEMSRDMAGRYRGMVSNALSSREGGVMRDPGGRIWNELLEQAFTEASAQDRVGRLLLVDLLSYLPGDILTKVDRMSMAHSLEARVPLLDHHLVEFAMRIPTGLKVRNGSGKWIFREAVRDLVPAAVLDRPKRGFGVPLGPWLRRELRHRLDSVRDPAGRLAEYLDMTAVQALCDEHLSGRRDHHAQLWKLIVLDAWFRRRAGRVPV